MMQIWRRDSGGRRLFLLMLLGGAALAMCSCDSQGFKKEPAGESSPQRSSVSDTHLQQLFEAISSPQASASLDLGKFPVIDPLNPSLSQQDQAIWPLYAFMMGEVYRLRGEPGPAMNYHQGLVAFAAANPYKDGWGVSGLAGVALWRYLQLAGASQPISPAVGEQILDFAAQLRKTRFMEGISETTLSLAALPQFQEEILRSLVSLAWNLGKKKEAQGFFLDYLTIARSSMLTPVEQALLDELMSSRKISPGKVALLLGKRLNYLGDFDGASLWLNRALERGDTQVKAEVSYYLAQIQRLKGGKDICATPKALELLGTAINYGADPDLVQNALFLQATLHIREGCPQNEPEFVRNLEQLIKDFPYGRRVDDAQYHLAMYYLNRYWEDRDDQDFTRALGLFEEIRKADDREDYLDSAWFKPALAYYTRGGPEDREEAVKQFQELEKARPFGPLHLHALFWLGRLGEESGDQAQAVSYFKQIIKEMPYSYYAIRARMHLNQGVQASGLFLPDAKTREQLAAKFQESQAAVAPPPAISDASPYHRRLKRALDSHLYYRSLCTFIHIKGVNDALRGQRIENIPLADMDQYHFLAPTAVWLSFRQDALAAIASKSGPVNHMEIAGAIRFLPKDDPPKPYGDWPMVIYLTAAMDKPLEVRSDIQNDPRYLAIAYPPVFRPIIETYSREFRLEPELIYSVIRQESAFYPLAMSPDGAMGLFQFSKRTFDSLNKRWKVLELKHKHSREDFLFDINTNIYLGARFFGKELLPRYRGDLALSLMDFGSGYPAVKDWVGKWSKVGKEGDFEYMMETARHRQTADLVRSVFATMSIVQAADIFRQ